MFASFVAVCLCRDDMQIINMILPTIAICLVIASTVLHSCMLAAKAMWPDSSQAQLSALVNHESSWLIYCMQVVGPSEAAKWLSDISTAQQLRYSFLHCSQLNWMSQQQHFEMLKHTGELTVHFACGTGNAHGQVDVCILHA